MEDVAKLETRVALVEADGEQKYWKIKLQRVLIILLLVAVVVLAGIIVKYFLESRKEEKTLKVMKLSFIFCAVISYVEDVPLGSQGGTQHIRIWGGSVHEIFRQPKNITSASFQPKNISSFYT